MLAHSPPLGVNDDADDRAHVGLAGLREYVEREHPAMLLHGHTYPPLPVERWGDTEVRHVRGHRFVTLPSPVAARAVRCAGTSNVGPDPRQDGGRRDGLDRAPRRSSGRPERRHPAFPSMRQ